VPGTALPAVIGGKTDADGRVWFVGAFEPDQKRAVNPDAASYSMGLGCYDPRAA
jgi:hypothetical protein